MNDLNKIIIKFNFFYMKHEFVMFIYDAYYF